jgi:hypothetical protein
LLVTAACTSNPSPCCMSLHLGSVTGWRHCHLVCKRKVPSCLGLRPKVRLFFVRSWTVHTCWWGECVCLVSVTEVTISRRM